MRRAKSPTIRESMGFLDFSKSFSKRAPEISGAVFFAALALGIVACGKKGGTPDWDAPRGNLPAATALTTPAAAVSQQHAPPPSAPERVNARDADPAMENPVPESQSPATPATEGLRFIGYNVENWLTMDRFVNNKTVKNAPKPDSEKKAVIRILVKNKPDIIGLCEIGEAKDLAEIQELLKAAGLDFPHSHYTGGSDPVRHLGLLSRFPITSTSKPTETEFQIKGQSFTINRGMLDATIQAHGKNYRFLGVHLKSKREIEEVDQEEMRIHEARLLRRHVDSILQSDAQTRLIVYGDFNDTRPTKAFKTVTGNFKDPGYLTAIPFKDSHGDAWTHHWALHDIYSRIDYVMVTRALRPEVDFRASHIVDDPDWNTASDHRPVLAIFR